LLEARHAAVAAATVGASVAVGLVAVLVGARLGRLV
jgi:fluoride ion exporter CrcB/FEX